MFFGGTWHNATVARVGVIALTGAYGLMGLLVGGLVPGGLAGSAYVSSVVCAGVALACGLAHRGRALKLLLVCGGLVYLYFFGYALDPLGT